MPFAALRPRLKEGSPLLATFSTIAAVEVVEMVGLAGFDGIILDTEHGSHQSESLGPLILAARARGIYPLVRVRSNEPTAIGAALDAGAAGIIVPQIGSAEAAASAVRAARFSPEGHRGANPFVRAANFSGDPGWYAEANRDTAVMLMIEGANGVADLPAILETPSLDGIFLGPVDLSHALGVPGETSHPRVIEAIEGAIDACRAAGLTAGVFAPTVDMARRWIARGVTLVGVGADTAHLVRALRQTAEAVRAP